MRHFTFIIVITLFVSACTKQVGLILDQEENIPRTEGGSSLIKEIEVIDYKGDFISVDEIILIDTMGCPEPHWHTRERFATSIEGKQIYEPAEDCGLGTVLELPIIKKEVELISGPASTVSSISIDAMINKNFLGSDFNVGKVLAENSAYTRYYITYSSGNLKISGIMNVPKGEGPFPLLILNHGYIDPAIYTNGRGLKREQDYLARQGYVVVHIDYRNHADSDDDPTVERTFRLGYTEDSINAINAVKEAGLSYVNTEKVGMLGHSMGGGVTLNTLVVRPDLVDAAVLFAPVSADYRRNYEKWTKRRFEIAEDIESTHGTPDVNPEFWDGVSAVNYFDRIVTPIMNHHGTIDDSVPLFWSDELEGWLNDEDIENVYHVYEGEPHEFTNAWPVVMRRTTEFFDQYLKK